MKVNTTCQECNMEYPYLSLIARGRVSDEGYVKCECKNGHRSYYYLQGFKFESLFYQAVHSLCNSEYESSYMFFYNTLENFYELVIKLFCRELTKNNEFIDYELLNNIKRSEQRLGAFKLVYYIIGGENIKLLTDNDVRIRNDIVHNGKFIDRDSCLKFGNKVLGIINEIISKVNKKYPNSFKKELKKKEEIFLAQIKRKNITIRGSIENPIRIISGGTFKILDLNYFIELVSLYDKQFEKEQLNLIEENNKNQEIEQIKIKNEVKNLLKQPKLMSEFNQKPIITDDLSIIQYVELENFEAIELETDKDDIVYRILVFKDEKGVAIEEINTFNIYK